MTHLKMFIFFLASKCQNSHNAKVSSDIFILTRIFIISDWIQYLNSLGFFLGFFPYYLLEKSEVIKVKLTDS